MDVARLVLRASFLDFVQVWIVTDAKQAGSIITSRFIMIAATSIISSIGSYYIAWPCAKIAYTFGSAEKAAKLYPACAAYVNGTSPHQQAVVHANFEGGLPTEIGAALNLSFGMALWVSVALHAIGVEVYVSSGLSCVLRYGNANTAQLHLTPKEAERLRNVSYQRQLEAGKKNPGSAGLTADRLGDSDAWIPQARRASSGTTQVGISDEEAVKEGQSVY